MKQFETVGLEIIFHASVLLAAFCTKIEQQKDGRYLFRKESALQTLGPEKTYI